jgi:hypothetical protein
MGGGGWLGPVGVLVGGGLCDGVGGSYDFTGLDDEVRVDGEAGGEGGVD